MAHTAVNLKFNLLGRKKKINLSSKTDPGLTSVLHLLPSKPVKNQEIGLGIYMMLQLGAEKNKVA